MSQYEQRLEKDLLAIRTHMRKLSTVTRDALSDALRSVFSGDRKLAYATVLGDAWVNERSREIDALCHRFIARHLPSAGHLRYTSAVIRAALQLERLGDYAVIIAREGVQLTSPPDGPTGRQLELVADQANTMLAQAIDAFNEGNAEKARTAKGLSGSLEGTMDNVYADLMATSDPARTANLVALFVIFNNLKRVSDQAKNLCEETLFAKTGETKRTPVQDVLFIEEDDSRLSQMAQAIGEKNHPGEARFASAGPTPAATVDPTLSGFLENHGFDMSAARPAKLGAAPASLSPYFVVVTLDGPIERYTERVPFHTSVLEWDVGPWPDGDDGDALQRRLQELYREISARVRELVETLRGEEVS